MSEYAPQEDPQEELQEELQEEQANEPVPESVPRGRSRKSSLVILVMVLIAATAITISEIRGGPLPTWDEVYSALGIGADTLDRNECLAVHFIDVGQGDSIFVQAPNGKRMLIDAGENGNDKKVLAYLDKYGSRKIDYVVATHPHSDHIGSLDEVINACTVHNVIMPRLSAVNTPATSVYSSLLRAVKQSKAQVISAKPGKAFTLGEAVCTVLSPSVQSENLNNMSVVLRVEMKEKSFLFTGDAETAVEKELMSGKYASLLDADVLKLGHHGSSTSSSAAFLKAVLPEYAVISCGVGNDYGHPHKETMQKLGQMETTVLRTDKMGSIRIYTDGYAFMVESDNG